MDSSLYELVDAWVDKNQELISNTHSVDCADLADAVSRHLERNGYKANVLQISTAEYDERSYDNECGLAIYENGKIELYAYHSVVLVNSDVVIDIRNLPFMKLDEYKKQLEEINANNALVYKILD